MSSSWSPPSTTPDEKNVHVETPPTGLGQVPTSALRVTLRTVPLTQLSTPVLGGSVTVIELPASPESPPLAETAKPIT